jgi:hypothetical protein
MLKDLTSMKIDTSYAKFMAFAREASWMNQE